MRKSIAYLGRGVLWCSSNLSVIAATGIYILCVVFLVYEIQDHGKTFGLSNSNRNEPDAEDLKAFSCVLVLMAVSGFMMLLTLLGSLIKVKRLIRDREQAWATSASHMKAIESSVDGIAILDRDGRYSYVNKAHAQCYGFESPADMIGRSWRDLYAPNRAAKFLAEVFPQLELHGEWSGQSEGRKKDGAEFPQEVSLKRLEDGGLICIVRDLTEKMRNDKLMRIIKLAVEAASDGIAITDEQNRILFMNRAFLKIHGYDPYERERYINTDWRLLYNGVAQEQINSIVLPTTIVKGNWSGSITVMKKDGSLFYGDASLTRLADGLVLGVMRDISDRRRAEMEREELKDRIFQSQKTEAIGRLTSRLADDFNNILDAVASATDTLHKDEVSNDTRKEHLARIESETSKARDLIDQLQAFSRNKSVKAGKMDLSDCVEVLGADMAVLVESKITFIADIRISEAFVYSTHEYIYQAVKNLCVNGFESLGGRAGKVVLALKDMDLNLFGLRRYIITDEAPDRMKSSSVRMKAGQGGKHYLMTGFLVKGRSYIQISVSDTGRGITPDILPSIFDPFFTTKAVHKGTGLGLSTVQGTVINAGGAIIVETAPEQGTTVHLFLPRYTVLDDATAGLAA